MKHLLRIIAGALIISGICWGLNTFRQTRDHEAQPEIIRPVRTITLKGGSESMTRQYFGTLQGGRHADLSFRVSGTLSRITAGKGASVRKGDLLAALDPRDFNTRLRQAQSTQSQAQAQYNDAQANFKRYENLYKQKVVPKATYDTYKTQVDVTRSAVSTAAASVKTARDALKDTELRAPFSGIITDRTVENFQDVTAKQTIFILQDMSTLEIVFNIPDNDIMLAPIPPAVNLKTLMQNNNLYTLTARFDAIPGRTFPLTLKEFSAQTSSSNTYPVTAVMPQQKDVRLLPGMACTVEVSFSGGDEVSSSSGRYSVPSTAILHEGNNNYVWRYNAGTVSRLPVNVGAMNNEAMVEVRGSDLKNGDVIVTAGVYFLREGQHVRLLED